MRGGSETVDDLIFASGRATAKAIIIGEQAFSSSGKQLLWRSLLLAYRHTLPIRL